MSTPEPRVTHRCDVILVGCGPTGGVLANLLGRRGWQVVVLEQQTEASSQPRAIHLDEGALRGLQATGLLDAIWPHTAPASLLEVVDDTGRQLLAAELADPDQVHGFVSSRFCHQPGIERALRAGLARHPSVDLLAGWRLVDLEEHDDLVYARARPTEGGPPIDLCGRWLIGCDGAHSRVREALGTGMRSLGSAQRWMVVDLQLRRPEDATLLPAHPRYVFDPRGLTVYAHGVGTHRRFELHLQDEEPVLSMATVRARVAEWVDPSAIREFSARPMPYESGLAESWRIGRVLLAGDAAHRVPPTAGQGMCAGIRDALQLDWRLDRVLSGSPPELMDSYVAERRSGMQVMLDETRAMDARLQAAASLWSWLGRHHLRLAASQALLHAWMWRSERPQPLPEGACADPRSSAAGRILPQVQVRRPEGWRRLDDVLGPHFALVLRRATIDRALRRWAEERHIRIWRPGVEFVEAGGELAAFCRAHHLEVLLIRPDRRVFGGGLIGHLPELQESFDARIGPPRQASHPRPAPDPEGDPPA